MLVAPCVTFAAVVLLVVAARFYERLPLKPAPCGLKQLTGIPCLSCGGTRSIRALAQGEILSALAFNPAVVLGVGAAFFWFILGWWRYRLRREPLSTRAQQRILKRNALVIIAILLANWCYLILFLPD